MRKNFIYFLLVPLLLFLLAGYLFLDKWIESEIEDAGETIFGARVEIDGLSLNFFPPGVEWTKIEVANPYNPWTNLFETGNVKFAMDFNQLLRKKYVIETVEVYGLEIGTKREASGELPENERKKSTLLTAEQTFRKSAENFINQIKETTPIFDIAELKGNFNPDSLIRILDIQTVAKLDSIRKQTLKVSGHWQGTLSEFEEGKNKISEIEQKIKSIDPAQLNNVQNITNAILIADNSIKSISDLKNTFEKRYQSINGDISMLVTSVDSVDDYVKRDYQNLKNMARLPNINTPSIAQLLVGNEMYKRVQSYLGYADVARLSIKKYQPEPEFQKTPRFEGQNIKFPSPDSYPDFWIKQIIVKGGKKGSGLFSGSGTVKNISDNQQITGLPTTVNLEGFLTNHRSINITGRIDRRKEIPYDEYSATLNGVPTGQFSLGKSDFLPTNVKDALLDSKINISLPANSFDISAGFKLSRFTLQFDTEPKNIFESIVRQVLERVKDFNVNIRMWNTGKSVDAALATDLDDQIAKRLKEVVGEELIKLQNQLKARFDSFIAGKRGEFEKFYNAKISEVNEQIDLYRQIINSQMGIVEAKKKELSERLEKAKSGLIENKLKELLKKQ